MVAGLELTPTFSYYILFLLLLITINDEDIESIGAHTQEGGKVCVCAIPFSACIIN